MLLDTNRLGHHVSLSFGLRAEMDHQSTPKLLHVDFKES